MKKLRDRLCVFSGEDFSIIRKCDLKIQKYFSLIGSLVLIILICCFISAFLFTESMFHNPIQDFGIAIVWGGIVTNLYLLLLYTISPTLLPVSSKKGEINFDEQNNNTINISFILRIGLLIILAIITAQPLNIYFVTDENVISATKIREMLSNNILAWFITLILVMIFLLPVYWKYAIRNWGGFYEVKAEIEKRIIDEDYQVFKQNYKSLLENSISKYNQKTWEAIMPFLNRLEIVNREKCNVLFAEISTELKDEIIDKYEYWADPPYRTIKKNRIKSAFSEEDFIDDFSNV